MWVGLVLISGDPSDSTDSEPSAHNYPPGTHDGRDTRLEKKGFSEERESESFFLPAAIEFARAAHGGMGWNTINQSHVLGTISRSMPGATPEVRFALSRSVAFHDSGGGVAASTSVDAYLSTYTYTYPLRALYGFDIFLLLLLLRSPHALYRVTQNRRDAGLASRSGVIANICSNFSRILRSSARQSGRCKAERTKENRAPTSIRPFFPPFFYLERLEASGRLNPPKDSPAISRRPLTTSSFV